jgi:hypothetical protein
MVSELLLGECEKRLVWTLPALDSGLLADAPDPLVRASGRVAAATCTGIGPTASEQIEAATESAVEEVELLGRR